MSENKLPESDSVPLAEKLPAKTDKPKTLEELLQEKAPEVLDAIPVQDRPKLARVTIEQTRIFYRSGILPDPSELAAYNSIIPNGADRIMRMTEAQSSHRIKLENIVVSSQQSQEKRGQWFGLIIALFFGSCGLYAAVNGQPWFGGVITGTTLVGLVGIFVYSKSQSKAELSEKRSVAMTPPAPQPASPATPPQPPQK